MDMKEAVDLLTFWFDMEADKQADDEGTDDEDRKLLRAGTFVMARVKEMEELLISARTICQRQGAETAWERFDESIAKLGIGSITARVYKVLPSDREPALAEGEVGT